MRIGKTIKVVTSPRRDVRKAGERVEKPIPVKIPEEVPVKAEWKVEWRMMYGVRATSQSAYLSSITS
jgi:hypothetical protein